MQDLAKSLGGGADWLQLWGANPGYSASPGMLSPDIPIRLGALYTPQQVYISLRLLTAV